MKLLQIEFALCPSGDLLIQDAKGVRTYREEDRDITDTLFAMIETDYPEAFAALQDFYAKSRHNLLYYKYKVVHRFLRCNFGRFDNTLDIDARGNMHFEFVDCPTRGECPYQNVICFPKYNTSLSLREKEVMKLLCSGNTTAEAADKLYLSEETVKTHRRNAYRRIGVGSLAEFMLYAEIHHLFQD